MSDEIVTIATYPHPTEAEMAKLKLEAEGIESIVANAMTSQMTAAPTILGGVLVRVQARDADRAIEILQQDLESSMSEPGWQVIEEALYEGPPHQAFAEAKQVAEKIAKDTQADQCALIAHGEVKSWFDRVRFSVEVRPEEGGRSRLVFSATGRSGDIRRISANKCVKRMMAALGVSPEPEEED